MCGEEGQPETDSFKCFGIALSRTGNFFKANKQNKKKGGCTQTEKAIICSSAVC